MILRIKIAFNSLVVILKENKLIEPNCIDWKRYLDIVLTMEEYKFVLSVHSNLMRGQPMRKFELTKSEKC